jgi:hypothetical protein
MKGDVHTLWKMSQPCKLVQILHPWGKPHSQNIPPEIFLSRDEVGGAFLETPSPCL